MGQRKKNMFITFEGIDGAGKSSQIQSLVDYLTSLGQDVLCTREPGGTLLGEKVRELLLHKEDVPVSLSVELLLVLAARKQHVEEVITPALAKGQTVISDRFSDATRAYQGYGGGLDFNQIEQCLQSSGCGMRPDLTFVLDIDVEESAKRRGVTGDRFENKGQNFLDKVRHGYLQIAQQEPERVKVISGMQGLEKVRLDIQEVINDCFGAMG